MSDSFSALKRSRKSQYEKLLQETAKMQQRGQTDERFWQPTIGKDGSGNAIIRFLPAPKGEDLPWVRIWSHGFQGPGGWYIENSLTTLNKDDPVGELNSKLWNNGTEAGKDQARKQKRQLSYYSNIYVVKDPGNPDNEGKVFLYRYGKKIFDKLNDLMHPEEALGEDPVNPFDFWEGANLKLIIRNVEGFRNYDKSNFADPSALSEDDDELKKIWESEYSLQEFLDPKNFKSYAELQARLNKVLAVEAKDIPTAEEDELPEADEDEPPFDTSGESEVEETDDSMDFFRKMAAEED